MKGVTKGGMTIGTLLTLFVVPSLYVLLARKHHAQERSAALVAEPA
jgi:Cu/Ag efflux pump CusA